MPCAVCVCVAAPMDSRTLFTDLGRIPACLSARKVPVDNYLFAFGAGPSRMGGAEKPFGEGIQKEKG